MSDFRKATDEIGRQIAKAASTDALQAYLPTIRDTFEVKHVIYQGWFGAAAATPNVILSTVSPQWAVEYEGRHVGEWDPIAKAARRSVLPIDWGALDWGNPDAQRYRLMLRRHDVGSIGLTVPLHGPHGNTAVFSITGSTVNEPDWSDFRRRQQADIAMLALRLHDRALDVAEPRLEASPVRLTSKVTACLELLAQGRKPAEIGVELGLSVHTVRKHLDRAVNDLSCQTKEQAITRALTLGLIKLRSTTAAILYLLCITPVRIGDFLPLDEFFSMWDYISIAIG